MKKLLRRSNPPSRAKKKEIAEATILHDAACVLLVTKEIERIEKRPYTLKWPSTCGTASFLSSVRVTINSQS